MILPARLLPFAAFALCLQAQPAAPSAASTAPVDDLRPRVVRAYADWCHGIYGDCEAKARELQQAVQALLEHPDAATLAAARAAWTAARRVYVQTEALRFYDGPIEPLEPLLNSWPVDEAYIDYVAGDPRAGIVQDQARYPRLGEAVLVLANERGGEANVSLGWHAIEFLLWGQDLRSDGAGERPASDYATAPHAARRGEYLRVATALLVRQLGELRAAWAPGVENYRRRFEADADGAVRRMLTGVTVLTAFELGGERLAVAYETQDQEQEHSCFSDTSTSDFEADQLGIARVVLGGDDGEVPGLLALVAPLDAALGKALAAAVADTLAKLRAIPAPFDQAMRGADDAPGRVAIRRALDALDAQAELLAIAGRRLGFDLPLRPGG